MTDETVFGKAVDEFYKTLFTMTDNLAAVCNESSSTLFAATANMMCEATEPLVCQPFGQPVDPDAAIRIEHDLDNRRVFKPRGDRRPQRGTQHARATSDCFRPE
jgi:hypothetical protein